MTRRDPEIEVKLGTVAGIPGATAIVGLLSGLSGASDGLHVLALINGLVSLGLLAASNVTAKRHV